MQRAAQLIARATSYSPFLQNGSGVNPVEPLHTAPPGVLGLCTAAATSAQSARGRCGADERGADRERECETAPAPSLNAYWEDLHLHG